MSPNDPVARLAAARARTDRALATGDTSDVARAFATWETLVDDDPLCYECLLGLGSAAALAGDAEQAEQARRRTLARDGDTRAADAPASPRAGARTRDRRHSRSDGTERPLGRVSGVQQPDTLPTADRASTSSSTDGAAGVPRLLRRVARSRRTCPGRDAGRRRPRCRPVDEAMARYQRWSSVSRMDNPSGWVYRVGLNLARRGSGGHAVGESLPRTTASEVPEPDVLEPAILRALRATGRPSLGGRVPAAPRMVRGGDRAGARHPAGHGQEPPAPGQHHARRPARASSSARLANGTNS